MHHVAGEICYLLKIRLKNNQILSKFMCEKLGIIPSITSIRTAIVLETIKETSNDWEKARKYFERAWSNVLKELKKVVS